MQSLACLNDVLNLYLFSFFEMEFTRSSEPFLDMFLVSVFQLEDLFYLFADWPQA